MDSSVFACVWTYLDNINSIIYSNIKASREEYAVATLQHHQHITLAVNSPDNDLLYSHMGSIEHLYSEAGRVNLMSGLTALETCGHNIQPVLVMSRILKRHHGCESIPNWAYYCSIMLLPVCWRSLYVWVKNILV